jgi:hypothetical protein
MASMIENIMQKVSGSGAIEQIENKLGTDRKTATLAAGAAAAMLLWALSRNAKNPTGASALNTALERDHDGSILDDIKGALGGRGGAKRTMNGQGILEHIFGPRRPAVEQSLGRSTGLNSQAMNQLLVMLAPIVMGMIGKARREQHLAANDLSRVLGEEQEAMRREQPHTTQSLNSVLDADGDGDVDLSDLTKAGSGLLNKVFGR